MRVTRSHQTSSVEEVSVVQHHLPLPVGLGVVVQVLDTTGVEGGAAADDAVDLLEKLSSINRSCTASFTANWTITVILGSD